VVTPVHAQRFVAPPETLADLARSHYAWHLVRGEVIPALPPGARTPVLPFDLPADGAVLARVDLEERAPYVRPRLLTLERGRDFYIGDGSATPALVRVSDAEGRLHPDVELHLGAPFVETPIRRDPALVTAYVRTLAVGTPVYVLGRITLETGSAAFAGPRDAAPMPRFGGDLGPLHLYDEPAFRQLAAWYALPWWRKLSLLLRNR
jgi:hypothetical protein